MLNGMLWIVRSGAQWRELPEAYGPWQSVYARFSKWRDDGTLKRVFHTLSGDADMENLSIDSTCIKVHESANGGEKTADKAVGRTRGGLNTKIHAVVDGLGKSYGVPSLSWKRPRFCSRRSAIGTSQDHWKQHTGRPRLRCASYPEIYLRA